MTMSNILGLLERWRAARALEAEIASVPADVFEAWDLSREEFRDIARMPAEQIARMERMAGLHGVVLAEFGRREPERQAAIALTCARCAENRTCRAALSNPTVTAEVVGFCPNSGTYRTLAAE
jgi:hypothetical protein